MNNTPLRTLPTDNNRKYSCAPSTAIPEKPRTEKQPRKFREGKIRRAKHHLATPPTNEHPTAPLRCSSGLCQTLPFFKPPTFEEVTGIAQYETEVQRTISIAEYRSWKAYQESSQPDTTYNFKLELEAGGFESYVTSKHAPQQWVNLQREKRHNITCEHYGPPRTPHPASIFKPSWHAPYYEAPRPSTASVNHKAQQAFLRKHFPHLAKPISVPIAQPIQESATDLQGLSISRQDRITYILSLYHK